jgi:Holliday junction resolvase RusA-like endonuclease
MSVTSMADAPFHCPPDVVIDLPPPISVNKLRRVDWANQRMVRKWRDEANGLLLVAKRRQTNPLRFSTIDRFELRIVLDENRVKTDADNCAKILIDYLCTIGLIVDDAPKHMRKVTIQWGEAPEGCRVTIRPCA